MNVLDQIVAKLDADKKTPTLAELIQDLFDNPAKYGLKVAIRLDEGLASKASKVVRLSRFES
jgi:hypothetical protein